MSLRDEVKSETPTGEALERVKQQQAEERRQRREPMNPDRDLSWENTNFEGSDYD